jgi:hypothetical protein
MAGPTDDDEHTPP